MLNVFWGSWVQCANHSGNSHLNPLPQVFFFPRASSGLPATFSRSRGRRDTRRGLSLGTRLNTRRPLAQSRRSIRERRGNNFSFSLEEGRGADGLLPPTIFGGSWKGLAEGGDDGAVTAGDDDEVAMDGESPSEPWGSPGKNFPG
jgi:hypothetical protein